MINIAIVEDNPSDAKRLKECLNYVKEKDGLDYCVTEFVDAVHFLFRSSFDFDLIFLDIQMPELDGMAAAKKIRESNQTVGIVFVTNMCQFAIQGYDVCALDFILKPISENDFYLKMKHVLSRLNYNKKEQLIIGAGDGVSALSANAILYIEVAGHYVTYHTGEFVLEEYSTLKSVEKKISDYPFFVRCNRYCIVNLNHVKLIKGDEVTVGNNTLVLSRSRKKEFYKIYARYASGMSWGEGTK